MNTDQPRWTPSHWMNTSMRLMLRTPGLQRVIGRSTSLLTFTGRKSGRSYTTPISYSRNGASVILTGHVSRQWPKNVAANPRVRLRLEGTEYEGKARILAREEALPFYVGLLEDQPLLAKISSVELDADGNADRRQAEAALEETVVVLVDLSTSWIAAKHPQPAGVGVLPTLEALGLILASAITTPILGRQRLRWGATAVEAASTLPGDELVPRPKWTYTYAIGIESPPADVWPWVAQIGQNRAGFYSYQTLENFVGCQIDNTAEILPEHQNPGVGDEVYLHPDSPPMSIAIVDPPHTLVLHGRPADPSGDGDATSTWQFCLIEQPDGSTRLLARGRSDYGPGFANRVFFGRFPIESISFVMSRKMLLEIKHLAERRTRTTV